MARQSRWRISPGAKLICGIAGIVAHRAVNLDAIAGMSAAQAHRGPDDDGIWTGAGGRVAFGHRRLAILDTTRAGHQPMTDPSGDLAICYNGEIYNYLELAAELRGAGARFETRSDTEVILAAYERWGEDCVAHFNGMFAFALYDRRRGRLFCARDRFGEKPFLFLATPDLFAFASEYKALLGLAEAPGPDNYDRVRLLRFLQSPRQGLDDDRDTLFPGIRQLLPGETLGLDLTSLEWRAARYWDIYPDASAPAPSSADSAARFRELLTDSVRLRLRSDVALGSCLSGGLDSGAVVCLAREILGAETPYHVFTGRFPGSAADEWEYARQVVAATGAISHVAAPSPEAFVGEIEDFVWHNELPVGSTSQYAQWCVFALARDHGITVLLDGQGGDELLGGYESYFNQYLAGLEPRSRRRAARAIRARYPGALDTGAARLKRGLGVRWRQRAARLSGLGTDMTLGLRPEATALLGAPAVEPVVPGLSPLHTALYRDSFHKHLPTLLRYGDRISMAHSREVRLPFCDHRLAEFVFSLPPEHLMGETQTKRVLREAMRGVLPEPVRQRWNKQGFVPPQADWFRHGLGRHARELFESASFADSEIWHAPWWRKALRRLEGGEDGLAATLWRPVIVDAWERHFVSRLASQARISAFA